MTTFARLNDPKDNPINLVIPMTPRSNTKETIMREIMKINNPWRGVIFSSTWSERRERGTKLERKKNLLGFDP